MPDDGRTWIERDCPVPFSGEPVPLQSESRWRRGSAGQISIKTKAADRQTNLKHRRNGSIDQYHQFNERKREEGEMDK